MCRRYRPVRAAATRMAMLRRSSICVMLGLTMRTVVRCFFAADASSPGAPTTGAIARQQPASAMTPPFRTRAEAIVRSVDTCYRHPGRETGVSCSNCGRPICPECMTTTSVGMRCPECSGQKTTVRKVAGGRGDEPVLTYVILGTLVLVELGALATGASATGGQVADSELLREGGLNGAAVADGEVYRLVTSGFLHFGVPHLLFNGFSLWILGSMLEPAMGTLRFALIYFVSLLTGSLGALLLEPDALTAGASGAVFGLMGAAFFYMRHRGIDPMQSGLGFWLALNLFLSFRPGISLGGHIGGLVGGVIVTLILFELRDHVRVPRNVPLYLAAGVGVLAIAGSVAVA